MDPFKGMEGQIFKKPKKIIQTFLFSMNQFEGMPPKAL